MNRQVVWLVTEETAAKVVDAISLGYARNAVQELPISCGDEPYYWNGEWWVKFYRTLRIWPRRIEVHEPWHFHDGPLKSRDEMVAEIKAAL